MFEQIVQMPHLLIEKRAQTGGFRSPFIFGHGRYFLGENKA
jgi:hypothetical protein